MKIIYTITMKHTSMKHHLSLLILSLAMVCLPAGAQTPTATDTPAPRPEVLIETTMGNIRIQLYNETPRHRDNFLKLIRDYHFYDSLLFHRVIPDFMVQSGDPRSKHAAPGELLGETSLDYTLPAEIRLPQLYHKRGAVAMAREGDEANPERRSSSTQFYIVCGKPCSEAMLERGRQNLKKLFGDSLHMTQAMADAYTTVGGTPYLDGAYTVFGEVTEGMDVVDRIQHVDRDANDRPENDVRIIRAIIVRDVSGAVRPKRAVAPRRTAPSRKQSTVRRRR